MIDVSRLAINEADRLISTIDPDGDEIGPHPDPSDLEERVTAIERRLEVKSEGSGEDDDDRPVVLVRIYRNTVELAHSNQPGLRVIVYDRDVIDNPSVVEEEDLNRDGVLELRPSPLSLLDPDIRQFADDKLATPLPDG